MGRTVHLVTEEFPPCPGGLELWTKRFAERLAKSGTKVVVYICGDQTEWASSDNAYDIVSLAQLRIVWEEPLYAPAWSERFVLERARLNFLILRNEIRSRIETSPGHQHLLISNFSVSVGYLAALVARDLRIPHVAITAGTDFSRGFRNSRERPTLEYVCKTAAAVVVKNREQSVALETEYGLSHVVCIPTSIEPPEMIPPRSKAPDRVTLFSDSGFSFKKGTGVLLDSFHALASDGVPVRLIVYGGISADQAGYWNKRIAMLRERFGDHVDFPGNVSRETVHAALAQADIYCSATLGEGSSSARIAAICAGLPVVTTRCGELGSGMEGVSHVRLANVADAADFLAQLRRMVNEVLESTLRIDVQAIDRWREKFSPQGEISAWAALIDRVMG